MAKKAIEIKMHEPEKPVSKSEARAKLAATIELYKKQQPVKYELYKAALEEKLKSL